MSGFTFLCDFRQIIYYTGKKLQHAFNCKHACIWLQVELLEDHTVVSREEAGISLF